MPFLQFESSIAKPLVKRKHGFGAPLSMVINFILNPPRHYWISFRP